MSLPTVDRTRLSSGAGVVIFQGAFLYSENPLDLKTNTKTFPIRAEAYGPIDTRIDDQEFKLSATLLGEWENLSVLFPYFDMLPGTLVFGADVPLYILSLTDDVVTQFFTAAITKMPDVTPAAKAQPLGEIEFTFLTKNKTARSAEGSLYSTTNLRSLTYTLTYGADTTAALAYNATATQVATALNALASVTTDGGVTVAGSYKIGFTVEWVTVGARAGAITATFAGWPSITALSVAVSVVGDGSHKEKRVLKLYPWTNAYSAIDVNKIITAPAECRWLSGGTFTLTFGANTTGDLAYNISAADLATALNALASVIAAGGVTVAGSLSDGWTVTFVAVGARALITGAVTSMPPATTVDAETTTTGTASVVAVQTIRLSPWSSFTGIEPPKVTWDLSLTARVTEAHGLTNYWFDGLVAKIDVIPDGAVFDNVLQALKVQGSGATRGRSLSAGGQNFDIVAPVNGTGTVLFLRIYGANISNAQAIWAANKDKVGTVEWTSTRVISGGTVNPIALVSDAEVAP
jgi:hypothetical protein